MINKNTSETNKVTFGKKAFGKHRKLKNKRDKSVSVYRGQGRP